MNVNAKVLAYIIAEVHRQGHKFWQPMDLTGVGLYVDAQVEDWAQRTIWMAEAWEDAQLMSLSPAYKTRITMGHIKQLGVMVEPETNRGGFRSGGVSVGGVVKVSHLKIPGLLEALLVRDGLTPAEFYREFEEIHPFFDGNGRTGKILLNWLNGTLDDPVMPPNFFNCSNP